VHLLRYVAKCTDTDWPLNTQTSCSKCPSACIHFLSRVIRDLVNLRSPAALLILLAAMRIRWSSCIHHSFRVTSHVVI